MMICEIILEINRPTNTKFVDGMVWIGDHFIGSLRRPDATYTLDQAIAIAVNLIKRADRSPAVSEQIKLLNPASNVSFVLYNSDYTGISVLKQLGTTPETKYNVEYMLKTISQNLFPYRDQILFMIDDNPRRIDIKDPEEYEKFPEKIKNYINRNLKATPQSSPRTYSAGPPRNVPSKNKTIK
jgi:hypothetical protein